MREWGSRSAGYLFVVQTWFLTVAVSWCHGRTGETTALLCCALPLCCSGPAAFVSVINDTCALPPGALRPPVSSTFFLFACDPVFRNSSWTENDFTLLQSKFKKIIKKTQIAHCTVPRILNHTAGAIRSASLTPPPTEIFAGMNVCQSHKPKLRLLSKEEHLFCGTLRIRACLAERAKSFRLECLISSALRSDRFPM